MESKKGLFSHFGVIIRIAILVILFVVIAFFIVRFVQNRQDTNKAKQTAQAGKSQSNSNNSSKNEKSEDSSDSSSQSSDSSSAPIPSGIADSDVVPTTGPTEVPATGTSADIFITLIMLSLIGFFVTKNTVLRNEFTKLR